MTLFNIKYYNICIHQTFPLQAIWSIVKKKIRAPDYSNLEEYPKFGSFVRDVIGLPNVSLVKTDESMVHGGHREAVHGEHRPNEEVLQGDASVPEEHLA